MKTQLKDGIWIEGFDNPTEFFIRYSGENSIDFAQIIYSGKTSEISEELAEEYVKEGLLSGDYMNYGSGFFEFTLAKESIHSACSQEYCIIYKTK